jgi:16S rRNA (cytidine1402-2'-O)-methyltransferase
LENIIPGSLYLVSTPIGNLQDITFRAIYILKSAHFIAAEDTRTTCVLLRKYDVKTRMTPYHSYNQKSQTPKIIDRLKKGEAVALVSEAGTPGISDPGYQLIKACIEADIRVIPVPGASAFLCALTASGLPIHSFVFEGFLPTKKGRKTKIEYLRDEKRTIVFYESPHRIIKTASELLSSWGDRKCVMAREITKMFEEIFRGTLTELLTYLKSKPPKGEIVLLIHGKELTQK